MLKSYTTHINVAHCSTAITTSGTIRNEAPRILWIQRVFTPDTSFQVTSVLVNTNESAVRFSMRWAVAIGTTFTCNAIRYQIRLFHDHLTVSRRYMLFFRRLAQVTTPDNLLPTGRLCLDHSPSKTHQVKIEQAGPDDRKKSKFSVFTETSKY